MDWWIEPFLLGFQQRALVGGLVAAATCSIVGVWLVLRGMSFFGDAFVHGVLPGIAAGVIVGFSPYLGAAVAAHAGLGLSAQLLVAALVGGGAVLAWRQRKLSSATTLDPSANPDLQQDLGGRVIV